MSKRVERWMRLVCAWLLAMAPLFGAGGASAAAAGETGSAPVDLILYHNLSEAEAEPDGLSLDLIALRVYADGHAVKADPSRLQWSSTNEQVATVDPAGRVQFTGQPGRTFVTVTDGTYTDRIALDVRPHPEKGEPRTNGEQDGAAAERGSRTADPDGPSVSITVTKESGDRYRLVEKALRGMTLEEKVGQMLMPDFRKWNGQDVTVMLPEIAETVRKHHLGGVILFRENLVTTEQSIRLIDAFQRAADKYGLVLSVDQEGGIVTRLQQGTDMPGNMALGAARSPAQAEQVGQAIGEELAALGLNMNFAPVLDVNNNPDNPVIGVRSFGEDPALAAELGAAYIRGLHGAGIAATGKHFPGHGDTAVDSHLGLPEVPHDRERLRQVEWRPFARAIQSGIDAIMTAHVTFPKIDGTKVISRKDGAEISLPATLSKAVLTGVIRGELGFDGVVVTDAMNMKAIADHFGPVDAAVRAVQAGADIVLMPVGLEEVHHGLLTAVRNGEIAQERIDEAVARILTLKLKRAIFVEEAPGSVDEKIKAARGVIASSAHKQLEAEAAGSAVTLVKNDGVLPLQPDAEQVVAVVGTTFADGLAEAVKVHHERTVLIQVNNHTLTADQERQLAEADIVILGSYTFNVDGRSPNHPVMQVYNRIIRDAKAAGKPVIGVAIRNPYDIMAYPDVDGYLTLYGFRGANLAAGADVLFGKRNPSGKLPVTIPDGQGGVLYPYGHGLTYTQ